MRALPRIISLPIFIVLVGLGNNIYHGNDLFSNPFADNEKFKEFENKSTEFLEEKLEDASDVAKDKLKEGVEDLSDTLKDVAEEL